MKKWLDRAGNSIHSSMGGISAVLIHGLARSSGVWSGRLLKELRRRGIRPLAVDYPSCRKSIKENTEIVYKKIENYGLKESEYILVGHSLGGLIALNLVSEFPLVPVGLVLLGSPLRGSRYANYLLESPFRMLFKFIYGPVLSELANRYRTGFLPEIPDLPIIFIRGRRKISPFSPSSWLGKIILSSSGSHDGTVAFDETEHPLIVDYIDLPLSHNELLYRRVGVKAIVDSVELLVRKYRTSR